MKPANREITGTRGRFLPGKSGNPSGRHKDAHNFGEEVRAFLASAHPHLDERQNSHFKLGHYRILDYLVKMDVNRSTDGMKKSLAIFSAILCGCNQSPEPGTKSARDQIRADSQVRIANVAYGQADAEYKARLIAYKRQLRETLLAFRNVDSTMIKQGWHMASQEDQFKDTVKRDKFLPDLLKDDPNFLETLFR